MEKQCFVLLFLLYTVTQAAQTDAGGTPVQSPKLNLAYTALQAWKSAISRDPNGILRSWVGNNVCSYKGVFCGGGGGATVVGIDLNRANLEGVLVKELSLLTDMTLLHLNSNKFSGTVPTSFKGLTSLLELDLSNNLLSGTFPSTTLYIPNLVYLDLRFNDFYGRIPDELFTRRLDAVLLNNNHFSGEIPETLGNSQASVINLANNNLAGNIPSSLGFMSSKVREILLLNNQLGGCIPQGIGLFSNLEVFDVSFNSLTGNLPDTISCLDQIEVLNLAHNKLSGMLPDMVCSLQRLMNLTVAYNFFSGVSSDCENSDIGFDFSGNCVPDEQMQRPPPQCSTVPGSSLSCLRIPIVEPLVCSVAALTAAMSDLTSLSSSNP